MLFALAAGTFLMAVSGVLTGRESDPGWWRASYLFNMLVCVMIAWATMALTRLAEYWLPERWLLRMRFMQIHRSTLVNQDHVEGVRRDDNSRMFVRMRGVDSELPVSRAYVHLFRAM